MVKLFQIEEPDGSPVDADMPGAAIGIDAGGNAAEIAVAVGGNPALLADREGFLLDLAVPQPDAGAEVWEGLFVGARLRAERALARPVSHAVLVLSGSPAPEFVARLHEAAAAAGIALLRIVPYDEIAAGDSRVFAAAILAEELVPPASAP